MSNTRVVELLVVDPETVLKGAEEGMFLATPQEVKAISLEIRRDRRN